MTNGQQDDPSFAELVDWLEDRLSAAENRSMAGRVAAADQSTWDAAEWIEGFLRLSRAMKASPSSERTMLLTDVKGSAPRGGQKYKKSRWKRK